MSKPTHAKQKRRQARANKAARHAASSQERYDRAEARRQVRTKEAAEANRIAAEARVKAWEAGAADREAEYAARRAQADARRAERAMEPAPEPRPRRARSGVGALTFLLMAGALMDTDRGRG